MKVRSRSVRPTSVDIRPKNKLLACLARPDFERLRPHLKTVPIQVRQTLHAVNETVREIYFLNGGVASMTTVMKDGSMVEIATVGREGLVGINAFFGGQMLSGEAMIQVPDTSAEVLSVEMFHREVARGGAFRECVQRYSQGLLMLIMQSAGCMALHHVNERCCKWLLMTHDRVGNDQFQLSHEFLAMMLGSTRPTVTLVAGALQKQGLIQYRHGRVTIRNRAGLEAASCECYSTVKGHFDRLGL